MTSESFSASTMGVDSLMGLGLGQLQSRYHQQLTEVIVKLVRNFASHRLFGQAEFGRRARN